MSLTRFALLVLVVWTQSQYQVDSFILCFNREFVSGVETLSFAWNKIITLNLWNTGSTSASENPGWEHVQMDDTYIYAATRGKFMNYPNFNNPGMLIINMILKILCMQLLQNLE